MKRKVTCREYLQLLINQMKSYGMYDDLIPMLEEFTDAQIMIHYLNELTKKFIGVSGYSAEYSMIVEITEVPIKSYVNIQP